MIHTLPKSLIEAAKKIITESSHPMIDVDGEMKHRHNSEGQPIHHTDEGIKNFHRWFGDSDSVDEHGRPKVLYHGTPALYRSQDEDTPLPFNEFKTTHSGVVSFSPTAKFARNYAQTKAMDAQSDMSPFVFKTYLKTKTFDPNNPKHIEQLASHLGDTVTHEGKYGWSSFGGEQKIPKEKFLEKLQGIHEAHRPLTKEAHESAQVGKIIPFNGGQIYVHHKTPTHLYYSEAYQMNNLSQEQREDLKSEAQKEPTEYIHKELRVVPYPSQPWNFKRSRVSIYHTTYVPAKEKGDNWEYTENDEVHNALRNMGYNAIKQTERKNENVAVLDKSQIKSASHNSGNFSHPTHIDE